MQRTGLITFCVDPTKDRVAPLAFHVARRVLPLAGTGVVIDEHEVLHYSTDAGHSLYFIRTAQVTPHDYVRYAPLFREHFPEAEFILVINWHEGIDAPDRVITFHTNGHVATGHFAKVSPAFVRNILLWSEHYRKELKLDDYRVLTEVTHWSGVIGHQDPANLEMWDTPVYDLEIGSSPQAWTNESAAEVLIRAAKHAFDKQPRFSALLCVGGMHFQEDYVSAVLSDHADLPLSLGHIIHTKCMESSDYAGEIGRKRFEHCISTIEGGLDGIVYHDKIRGPYKETLRRIAGDLNIPAFKHQRLRSLSPDLLNR